LIKEGISRTISTGKWDKNRKIWTITREFPRIKRPIHKENIASWDRKTRWISKYL